MSQEPCASTLHLPICLRWHDPWLKSEKATPVPTICRTLMTPGCAPPLSEESFPVTYRLTTPSWCSRLFPASHHLFVLGLAPCIWTVTPPTPVLPPPLHIGWNPPPPTYVPVTRNSVLVISLCSYHTCLSVYAATTYPPACASRIGCATGVASGPPVESRFWTYSVYTWSALWVLPGCLTFPDTLPPGTSVMSSHIGRTSHMSPAPLHRRPPLKSVSWLFHEISPRGGGATVMPSPPYITRNLPYFSSSPWTWILFLSTVNYTPPLFQKKYMVCYL